MTGFCTRYAGLAIMKFPQLSDVATSDAPVALVGRLTPLPGVLVREHPHRRHVQQFLKELRLPLAAGQAMLDLVRDVALPESVELALAAIRNHNEFLQRLTSDYSEYGRLEQNTVAAKPAEELLRPWLDAQFAAQTRAASELGIELLVGFRSFLPSSVMLDGGLVARALDSILHVAMQRSRPGRLDLSVSFDESHTEGAASQLVLDVRSRGGGFREIEHGYVFSPFHVRDAAARPLLGLSLGQRLAELLGGGLRVESSGASMCSYRLSVAAEPAEHAVWLDPVSNGAHLGPVRPGRVLFVGRCGSTVERCRGALERAGYTVDRAEREELVLSRLESRTSRWSAVVVDATCTGETLWGFVDAVRELGYGAALVSLVEDSAECRRPVAGVDAILCAPNGQLLLKALREARDYNDRKKAIKAS